jgi:hypothetical protein
MPRVSDARDGVTSAPAARVGVCSKHQFETQRQASTFDVGTEAKMCASIRLRIYVRYSRQKEVAQFLAVCSTVNTQS